MPAMTPYWQNKLESLKASKGRALEKARELSRQAVTTAEGTLAAGAIGYLETKREAEGKEPYSVFGFDLEEAIALGGHAAILFGLVGGAEAEHVRAFANGAAAVYGYKRGRDMGARVAPGTP
jgi:hypothetical protein